jgi:hypothetical protein
MPTLLHSQQGCSIVKNDHNGFTVVTLHYSADPKKRSPEWKREAAQGLSKAKFEQEYEISYDALMGERVFPEIKDRASDIIYAEGPFLEDHWPPDLPMWGGFDYGARNPSSFHVYTIHDKVLYAIWELYEPCKNILEFAQKMKDCPYWGQIKYIASDPDIFNLKQRDMKTGLPISVESQFRSLGVNKLLQGNTDEAGWIAQVQRRWQSPEVTFKIHASCRNMITEFESSTYVSMSERQLETQNYREAMVDKKNHSLDDCKYFMNSCPNSNPRKVRLPGMVSQFSPWGTPPSLYEWSKKEF